MSQHPHDPGQYTLGRWTRELMSRGPLLLRTLPDYLQARTHGGAVASSTSMAMHLRLARLLGCPVCLELFPRLASLAGMSSDQAADAVDGRLERLPEEMRGALTWVEELVVGGADEPELVPSGAMALSSAQRTLLLYGTRLSMLVHSTGLMFLPHRLIEKAAGL